MPLPGGPADKLGNRYELWWTVVQFIRILDGKAKSISIEDLSVDKAEFSLTVRRDLELHQAKRSHPSGKWSLASLDRESILQTLFCQLHDEPHKRFVFVSGSDAPELRELTERARFAKDLQQFQTLFLEGETRQNHFERIKEVWTEQDDAEVYSILQRIEVRTTDEQELQDRVHDSLAARFLTMPHRVSDAFRTLAEDSIHRTLDRRQLVSHIENRGLVFRKLRKPDDASALVTEVTDKYLRAARKRLIQGSLIPRPTTNELLTEIQNQPNGAVECVLTGKAGGGKTGCVIECVEALRQQSNRVIVLAFRLGMELATSTKTLGEQLELEESPVLVLATAAEDEAVEAVLMIDQLDAVSTTSGRNTDLFDVVHDLANEARGLADRATIHLIVVCRNFDWDNDYRMRDLFSPGALRFTVPDFSEDEVKGVLASRGFLTANISAQQLEILRLPQNLKMFLDVYPAPDCQPDFNSPKDLFDLFWKSKRIAVNHRASPQQDCWNTIIKQLCTVMTSSQQLFVSKEHLDDYPDAYLESMVSEGVLSVVNSRFGFGHELFFDYCVARNFVSQEIALTTFLLASDQHLFHRAQVRQILAYLRDDNPERYAVELRSLLADQNIRTHLKDLALAWAFSLQNPREDEWNVVAPWLVAALGAVESGKPDPNKMTSLVWNRFFYSTSWFHVADQKHLAADWLESESDQIVDMGTKYVRVHQRHAGDRVAALLEPFVGREGKWAHRLCFVMQWAQLEHSRELFKLFLRLVDEGTLDNLRNQIAANGTFWSMLAPLATQRPSWIAEVLAHWLERRFCIVRQSRDGLNEPKWHLLFNHDQFGPDIIKQSATKAPDAFVRHVLPVVLAIANQSSYNHHRPAPNRDAVWTSFVFGGESSMKQACIHALAIAVEQLAESKSHGLDDVLASLRSHSTYTANFILLRAFTAGAEYLMDEAVCVLCDEPWRFECGYVSSSMWVSKQLVASVVRCCTQENRNKLEAAILDYRPQYDRSRHAHKQMERPSFELLSSIPADLRSQFGQKRYLELERKFKTPQSPPQKPQVYRVRSPIDKRDADKLTDDQWLRAIGKYDTREGNNLWDRPWEGGSLELARTLGEMVKQDPRRFGNLSLAFPLGTHPDYMDYTLRGLKDAVCCTELKLDVCRKAFAENREAHGEAIADLLGACETSLAEDAVQILGWLATRHPDPIHDRQTEMTPGSTAYGVGDVFAHGINTARGRAALAVAEIVLRNESQIQQLRPIIERLVNDYTVAVRSCVAGILLAVYDKEPGFATEQFLNLVRPQGSPTIEDQLLTTPDVKRFLLHGMYEHFEILLPVIARMLRADVDETCETGARLASMAALLGYEDAVVLAEAACVGHVSQRLGVAQVASSNIGRSECRHWAEAKLLRFFDDSDKNVRREAASCFRNLSNQSLEPYEDLIRRFCSSTAFDDNSFHLLSVLDKTRVKLPEITLTACRALFERFGAEANDIRTSRSIDGSTSARLILRIYHQYRHDPLAVECLDLIDDMCLEGFHEIRTLLNSYER